MYRILIERKAAKSLSRLNSKSYRIIADAIRSLSNFRQARNLDVKPLKGKFQNMWRLRVGSRRVLFTVNEKNKEITIWIIENRGDVY